MSVNNTRPYIPHVPRDVAPGGEAGWRLLAAAAINEVIDSKGTGDITLTHDATTTVLKDPKITVFSHIDLMPTTANAGAAKASASFYIVRSTGSATVHHASSVNADQIFTYVVNG